MKKFILSIFVFSIFFSSAKLSFAQSATTTPQPTPYATPINSFEAFWPMVAGKTRVDSLYSLKRFKEKLRGTFIFGAPAKANYQIMLANKRLLEAEKLIKDNKLDAVAPTLDSMKSELGEAMVNISSAKEKKILNQITPMTLVRIDNMGKLLMDLQPSSPDSLSSALSESLTSVENVSTALK